MARKPNVQPVTTPSIPAKEVAATIETLGATRNGRKTRTATPAREPSSVGGTTAMSDVAAHGDSPAPIDTPRRKLTGRRPEPSAAAASAPQRQDDAGERSPKLRKPKSTATPDAPKDTVTSAEAAPQGDAFAVGDTVQPDIVPGRSGEEPQQPLQGLDAPAPAKAAARWDPATDTVQFDWPAIERTAAQDGPNQGMAKLLIAARAEGANSRWPL